jgi:hypothetical protein
MPDEHNSTLVNLRIDEYGFGGFEDQAETRAKYDYSRLDYEQLGNIYEGLETTGMQYGAMLSRTIVDTLSAFEIGKLPIPVVYDAQSGVENPDVTKFAQTFFHEQHWALIDAVTTKNKFGDGYVVFNLDRNLESLPPKMVLPGWAPFSSQLESATVIQMKKLKSKTGDETADLKIIRNYNAEQIKYTAEIVQAVQGVKKPKAKSFPNPLGICPVVHIPNLRQSGYQFGVSDFYSCIPYFILFHQTLMRGFEAQQYSGRPILTITGIPGSVEQWLLLSFGIDVNAESEDSLSSKILDMFKKHKMLALSGDVKAQFVESATPTGKTTEILAMCLAQIARLSTIPEFVFGAQLDQGSASVREQYAALRAKIMLKQAQLTPYLRHILRMAMVWYTTQNTNDETGISLDTYSIASSYEETLQKFKIELIWPEFLGQEQRNKIEALALMSQGGAISRKGLMKNYQDLVPSPDGEMEQIKLEMQELGALQAANDPQASQNADERNRKNTSGSGDNPDASRTDRPGSNKAGKT